MLTEFIIYSHFTINSLSSTKTPTQFAPYSKILLIMANKEVDTVPDSVVDILYVKRCEGVRLGIMGIGGSISLKT